MEYMISELDDKFGGIMFEYAQKSYPDPCEFSIVYSSLPKMWRLAQTVGTQ